MTKAPMIIDFFGDLSCPWCYLGLKRLKKAVQARPQIPTLIQWQPFLLNPDLPPLGVDRATYLEYKFGSKERAQQIYHHIQKAFYEDHINVNFDDLTITPNTILAHALISFTTDADLAILLAETLMHAFFEEGMNISDPHFIYDASQKINYPPELYDEFILNQEILCRNLLVNHLANKETGIQAVPCLIFNDEFMLAGAQEEEALLPLLDTYYADRASQKTPF